MPLLLANQHVMASARNSRPAQPKCAIKRIEVAQIDLGAPPMLC